MIHTWRGSQVCWHPFNIRTACHVDNSLEITMTETVVPGFEARHPGCNVGVGDGAQDSGASDKR